MNQNEQNFFDFYAKLKISRQKVIKFTYLNPSELNRVLKILQDMASSPTAVTLGVGGAAVAGTVTNNGGTVN